MLTALPLPTPGRRADRLFRALFGVRAACLPALLTGLLGGYPAGAAAVTELYRCGHRRIAALVARTDDRAISQLRYQGYLRALADCGLPTEEELVIRAGSFDIGDAYRATAERLRQGADFTAVFSIADNMALGAMRALREAGRRVPEDCSVIAIDGLTMSEYFHPMLTTLMEEMGRRSVEILMDMIHGRGRPRCETVRTVLRRGASVRRIN